VTDDEAIALVRAAFAGIERPEHFTNYTHCGECFEHDETLRTADIDRLDRDVLTDGGWDPITMATPLAFAYYLPALARIVTEPEGPTWSWYGPQLCSQLSWNGPRNERWAFCTPEQRQAVARLLEHVLESRAELIEKYDCQHELLHTLEVWWDGGDEPVGV
jgi:hypothetical protein